MAEPVSVADQALKRLADQLECAICLDSYTDPKLLQCFHVFCKKCLEPMVLRNRQGLSLRCPNCRQSTLLPANGVSGLQPAFHIHHLFEIQDAFKKVKEAQREQKTLCGKCKKSEASGFCCDCSKLLCVMCITMHKSGEGFSTHKVISLEQLQSDIANLVPPAREALYCSNHPGKELDLFCETDEELICRDCIIRTHRDHQYCLVDEAFPKHRDAIVTHLQPIRQRLDTVNEEIQYLDTRYDEIIDQRAVIEADIHRKIQQLHDVLEMRKTQLIGQLHQLTQQKLKSLSAERDELELIQTRFSSCLEYVSESLKTGSKGEILGMKKSIVPQIEEMNAEFKLPPQVQADTKFTTSSELIRACRQFGQVYQEFVCPEKCYVTGEGVKVANLGEHVQNTVTVHAIDSEGVKCARPFPDTVVSCELVCCSYAERMRCYVKHTKTNEYEIDYQPTTRGRHKLHVKVNGQHIKDSPFSVATRGMLQPLPTPVRIITDVKRPWGVAFNERGQTIVSERFGHCVSIYGLNGEKIRTFGQKGAAHGEFKEPNGVAVDRDNNMLVVDRNNHRIQKFTAEGKFMVSVGRHGGGPCEFYYPTGIGIGPNAKVYVTDQYNHRIQILNPDLTFSSSFGSRGTDDGQFQNPLSVACNSRGNVYVADMGNQCIKVFTDDGQFLRKFWSKGPRNGRVSKPAGIAIDSDDLVYVAEMNNYISLFNCNDDFLMSLANAPSWLFSWVGGQFDCPVGIAVDKDGLVYVNDRNRLQIL